MLTCAFPSGNTDALDAMLLRVVDFLSQKFPVTGHELGIALKNVNARFKANGADVARKRFALVRLLAPAEEHVPMADALEHALVCRKLSADERTYFARVQTRWRTVLAAVGKNGTPKFAALVDACVAQLELCLPRPRSCAPS